MFGRRKKKATVQIPSLEIPSLELGGGRLPTIRTPELRTPEIELPRLELPRVDLPSVQLPAVDLGGLRLPHLETPSIRTPRLDFELLNQPPFVRRRRKNPVVQGLKFVVGVGVGLVVGCVVAALLAPKAGDDTRRALRELASGGGDAPGGEGAGSSLAVATGAVREGVAGLLSNPRGRFQVAMEEARKEREARERQLLAEFQTAKRTGSNPS